MTLRAISFVAVALSIGACTSHGNEVLKQQSPATVDLIIIDGKTTRDEVQAIYGAPLRTSLTDKSEIWTYQWYRSEAQAQNFIPVVGAFVRGYDVRRKELIVVFDEKNIVARHTMTDFSDTVKSGFLDPGNPLPSSSSVTKSHVTPPATAPSSGAAPTTSAPAPPTTAGSTPAATSASPTVPDPTTGQSRSRL